MGLPSNDAARVIITIDPGQKGAVFMGDLLGQPIAWLAADDKAGGYYRGKVFSTPRLVAWMRRHTEGRRVALVVIEQAGTRPKESTRSALTIGTAFGQQLGIIQTLELPLEIVTPTVWCKAIHGSGVKADERKERSILKAQQRMPGLPLVLPGRTVEHDGLADAACIYLYGLDLVHAAAGR